MSRFPEGRACAVVFDCKFIETSASLQHNVAELFEGVVRQIRLRRDGGEAVQRRHSIYKRKESLTQKARRFLDRLVARNNQRMAVKVRSKSCHDLAVLWGHMSSRSVRSDFLWLLGFLTGCNDMEDGVSTDSTLSELTVCQTKAISGEQNQRIVKNTAVICSKNSFFCLTIWCQFYLTFVDDLKINTNDCKGSSLSKVKVEC